MSNKQERGFAAMDPKAQLEIARKGGRAVSANREHMAQIGRKGGEARSHRRNASASALNNESVINTRMEESDSQLH